MSFMMVFLGLCLILGLWRPLKARSGWIIVALAVVMVTFFLVSPRHM